MSKPRRPNPMPMEPPPGFAIPERTPRPRRKSGMRRHLTQTIDVQVWIVYALFISVAIEDVGDHDWSGLVLLGVGVGIGALIGLWQRRKARAA